MLLTCCDLLDVCSVFSCILCDTLIWYSAKVWDKFGMPLLLTSIDAVAFLTLAFLKEWLSSAKIYFLPFLVWLWNTIKTLFDSVDSHTYLFFFLRSQLYLLIIKNLAILCDECVGQYINVKSYCCRLEGKCCL